MIHRTGLHPTVAGRQLRRMAAAEHPTIRGALRGLRGSADLTQYAPIVLNQGMSSTCWAHSAVTLLYTRRHVLLGGAPVLMSPLYFAQTMYATYRAQQNPGALPAGLSDDGAQLDDAAACFAKWGCSPMGASQQGGGTDVPATEDDLGNQLLLPELSVSVVERGALVPFGGEYDIQPNTDAPETVAACLESNIPVWIGGLVGSAVQELQAGQIEQPCPTSDPTSGGHARAIIGYRVVSGAREFLIRNSWGSGWCESGNSWAAASVLSSAWSLLPFEVK